MRKICSVIVSLSIMLCMFNDVHASGFSTKINKNPIFNGTMTVSSNNGENVKFESEKFQLEKRTIDTKNTVSIGINKAVQYADTFSAVVCIDKNGNTTIQDTLELPPVENISLMTTEGATKENTYWKASVTINYIFNEANGRGYLSRVSGSWTQLRGSATLSNRTVMYNQSPGGNRTFQYPTSNTFGYGTGFSEAVVMLMGCKSTVDYNAYGATGTLIADVNWSIGDIN